MCPRRAAVTNTDGSQTYGKDVTQVLSGRKS